MSRVRVPPGSPTGEPVENSGSKMKINGDLISKTTLFCASISLREKTSSSRKIKCKHFIFARLLVLSRFETIFLTKMSFSLAPWDANSRRLTRSPFSSLLISEFSEFENSKHKHFGRVGRYMNCVVHICYLVSSNSQLSLT